MKRQVSVARVSSTGQDEEGQVPELAMHAQERGYEEIHCERIYAKSASKGDHLDQLETVIRMVEGNLAEVVALVAVDRFNRQGILATLMLVKRIYDHGGSVEFTNMPHLWDKPYAEIENELSQEAADAQKEGIRREERKDRGHKLVMQRGAALRKCKYGWELTGGKRNKAWSVIPERADLARKIFERVADGMTLRDVCEWARTQDTDIKWWYETVRRMIGDRAYIGQASTTLMVAGEKINYTWDVPPIVEPELWERANAKLAAPKRYRPRSKTRWAGILYCPFGHKLKRGSLKSQGSRTWRYWSCPECKWNIRDDTASSAAHDALLRDGRDLFHEKLIIPEDTREIRRVALEREADQLTKKLGRRAANRDSRMIAIDAELDSIEAESKPRGRIDRKPTGEQLCDAYKRVMGSEDETAINDLLRSHNVHVRFLDQEGSLLINAGMQDVFGTGM